MTEEARQRLFVAVEVPAVVREALDAAVAPLRSAQPALRWTDPAMWHLTVAFVGSVEAEQAPSVDAAVASAAAASSPFEVQLSGEAGTFGVSVLYADFEPAPELVALADVLRHALRARGFAIEERPLVPHLTIARVPRGSRLPPAVVGAFTGPALAWTVERLLVVRSRLSVGGATHSVRSAHVLGAGA